ncbi:MULTISPECIES: aminotransferase class V-fold PLP-dependent enzyme [Actinoplanes]|uniref:aminotransferase class V-fold PLP-dependent enzyme n=1 Tax=Actinoplanes TaxID=1865 RepID=UPI0005F2A4B0|nr:MULTISPECIES: aminotransferase class V-fold PLP-dependent enzyme [Actinoplanes]GLY02734.1 cysteine desulfurase [Actinoplanes sp. NBRC 101535]
MIYLDYAATSHPKPPTVLAAMTDYLERAGNPGRSGHRLAQAAEQEIWAAREAVAGLLHAGQPDRVVFTANATTALNIAIAGLVQPDTRCLTSAFEHNSVVRPLHALAETGVTTTVVPPAPDCPLDLNRLEDELRRGGVSLVVVSHASNVTGTVLPVTSIHDITTRHGVPLVLDASQSAGHLPVQAADAEVVVFAGHKGLFGPQGTGGMHVSPRVTVRPLLHGGTGGRSELPRQPRWLPYALESGTPNGVGIAGLRAGVQYILGEGIANLASRERVLRDRLADGLRALPGIRLRDWPSTEAPVPVVSATFDGLPPGTAAMLLEERYDVLVRAGLHCAPAAHRTLTTIDGGTVRFALSHLTSEADIDTTIGAVADLAKGE